MVLKCLGSSSAGNTYLLTSEAECLILEAGIPFKEIKKALDFNVSKIVGVVCSHSHGDHFGHAEEYLRSGIPVYAPEETHGTLSKEYDAQRVVRPGYWYKPDRSRFEITPFPVEHDIPCFGYIIRHPDVGTLIFATDTAYIRQNFKSIKPNHIMIEANYSEEIIQERLTAGEIDEARVNRTYRTHMSIETCCEFLRVNKSGMLDNVFLLHMSDSNADANRFVEAAKMVVGNQVNVYEAKPGLEVKTDLFPW